MSDTPSPALTEDPSLSEALKTLPPHMRAAVLSAAHVERTRRFAEANGIPIENLVPPEAVPKGTVHEVEEVPPALTPGNQTSEGRRTWWQTIVGYLIAVIGGVTPAIGGAVERNDTLAMVGSLIAVIGGAIAAHGNKVHAESRKTLKLASMQRGNS